jgi:hypothetical protein
MTLSPGCGLQFRRHGGPRHHDAAPHLGRDGRPPHLGAQVVTTTRMKSRLCLHNPDQHCLPESVIFCTVNLNIEYAIPFNDFNDYCCT